MTPRPLFDSFFPPFRPTTTTVKEFANLADTLALIPKVVRGTLDQTSTLAPTLVGRTVTDTCRNTWAFCKRFFKYKQDADGTEQVRSPRRSWHDREAGIDCDCFSTLISSILTNLRIPHMLRVTKYGDYAQPFQSASAIPFSHIYVVALDSGREVKIDPVTDRFDYEVPYHTKKDIDMGMTPLNGSKTSPNRSMDCIDLGIGAQPASLGNMQKPPAPHSAVLSMDCIDLGIAANHAGLGKKPKPIARNPATTEQPAKARGSGANAINRQNPEAILIRTGILVGMKLNMYGLGTDLRYAYLTDAEAQSRKLNMARLAHLRKVQAKLEHLVFVGGGNPEHLKKAILEGKGNHDGAVTLNGLGMVSPTPLGYGSDTPVSQILGPVIYHAEVTSCIDCLSGIDEPVTASAAIEAAKSVLAGAAAIVKSIGNVRMQGTPGSKVGQEEDETEDARPTESGQEIVQQDIPKADGAPVAIDEPVQEPLQSGDGPTMTVEPITTGSNPSQRSSKAPTQTGDTPKRGIGQWAKDNPILALGAVSAVVALGLVVWKAVSKPPTTGDGLHGIKEDGEAQGGKPEPPDDREGGGATGRRRFREML